MLIDTHCHLDFSEFDMDREMVIERARNAGVACLINVGSSLEGSRRSVQLAEEFDIVFASIGIHPHYAKDIDEKILDEVRTLVKAKKVAAIGEVGLDYYGNDVDKDIQKARFADFLNIAQENNLPVIVHNREAHKDTFDMLKGIYKKNINGVMHCFSADENYLKDCLNLGLYISFTCNLTFKNAKRLRDIAKNVPLEKLLLETDAPFLAPQQFRGKRNEPSYLTYLLEEWSAILGVAQEDIAHRTTENAKKLFKLQCI